MALPAHTRTWHFLPNNIIAPTTALANNRLLMKAIADSLLGRGTWYDKDGAVVASAGNWTATGGSDGLGAVLGANYGTNDNVNYWDTGAGHVSPIDVTKINWAAAGAQHSWLVLQQTGVAAKYQLCLDMVNATTTNATIVLSFGTGFGVANLGADGTNLNRPTALDQQILLNSAEWGGGSSATAGIIWNAAKTTDGKSFRFWAYRSGSCIAWWQFEVPDPVVTGWTDPSVGQVVGQSTTTEQLTMARLTNLNTYSKTPGGTIFTSSWAWEGTASNTNTNTAVGHTNDIDNSQTFRQIHVASNTVNARYINGTLVDIFWGQETGQVMVGTLNGQIAPAVHPPAANAVQWTRVGALWTPWLKGDAFNPRIEL